MRHLSHRIAHPRTSTRVTPVARFRHVDNCSVCRATAGSGSDVMPSPTTTTNATSTATTRSQTRSLRSEKITADVTPDEVTFAT